MPSNKIAHADGLSRLIPDNAELLEETVMAALKQEQELKEVLINTVSELPVTLEEIKKAAKTDECIINMNKQVKGNKKTKKTKSIAIFNMWRNLDVCSKSSNTTCFTKESLERISFGSSGYIQNEIINEKLQVLAENGPGHWGFGKTL